MRNAKYPRPLHNSRDLTELFRLRLFAALSTSMFLTCFVSFAQSTNNFPIRPISLADAVNLALTQSPNVRRAQKDLEASQGVVIQTRAIAVPKLRITGDYDAKQKSDVDIISTNGFDLGSAQNWDAQIRVVQSLYEGGRIASSLRVAKLTKEQAMLNYQTAVADTVLDVQVGYFDVLVAEQQIVVQEASVELLSRELADTN